MVEYQEIKINGETIKLFNSFVPQRLEEETYLEYKYRRQAIKNYMSSKDKQFKHVANMLIPKMTPEGNLELDLNKRPIYIGKTKGVSYVKDNKKEEHMGIV